MALNDKQVLFVEAYCDAVEGGVAMGEAFRLAKTIAGYSENTSKKDILSSDVVDEIIAFQNRNLVITLPKAVAKLHSLMDDPEQGGAAILLSTVNTVMDRGGLVKKEAKEINVKSDNAIIILPSKSTLDPE